MISIDEYATSLFNKSANTQRMYLTRVKSFLKWANKKKKPANQMTAIEFVQELGSSSTKNQTLAAIRLFLSQSDEKINLLKSVPTVTKPREHLDKDEQDRLLRARLGSFYDVRNQVMIRLMMKGGCRISEVCGLKLKDIDLKDRSVKIRGGHVKGVKDRLTYIDNDTSQLLQFYLKRDRIKEPEEFVFKIDPPAFRRAFKQYL